MRIFLVLSLLIISTWSYLPVICLHGMGSNANACSTMKSVVQSSHHGTFFWSLAMYENAASFVSLNIQVNTILKTLKARVLTDTRFWRGFHLVCHSQGALLCRCITEAWDNHKIHTLVSLAGPQMGVWSTAYLENYVDVFANYPALANITVENAYRIFNGTAWQRTFNIANLWHDAHHEQDFLDNYMFLPIYNNLVGHEDMDQYKSNFASLKQAVFLMGDFGSYDFDGGVGPWQSGVFGYYGTNFTDYRTMKDVTQHRIWIDDTIGLRALDDQNRLVLQTVKNVKHGDWLHDRNIIQKYYLNYLV